MKKRERRKFPRLNSRWQINFRVIDSNQSQKDPICQYTNNISRGGICFTSDGAIEPNAMVALELAPDTFSTGLLALAKVVRCTRTPRWYEIGAEFWWIGWRDDGAPIANYLASLTDSGKYPPPPSTSRILRASLNRVEFTLSSLEYTSNEAKDQN